MKWKRTAMSLALAGCMMATTVPVTAFAANETTVASEKATNATAIKFVDSSANLVEGNTVVAQVVSAGALDEIVDTNDLEWASNDPTVATVTPTVGNEVYATIQAVSEGETTITAKYKDNDPISFTVKVSKRIAMTGFTLDVASLNMEKDDEHTLKATYAPANMNDSETVSYSIVTNTPETTGQDVIDLDTSKGKITAKNPGTAVVRASVTITNPNKDEVATKPDVTYTQDVNVYVSAASTAKLNTFEVTADSSAIKVGKSTQLTPKFNGQTIGNCEDVYTGSTDVTYTTTTPNFIEVSSTGLVTGKAKGTGYVTAICNGKTAVVTIAVNDVDVAVTGVAFDKSSMSLSVGAKNTVSVKFTPENNTEEEKYGRTTVTVADGSSFVDVAAKEDRTWEVTGKAEGTATLKVQYTTESGAVKTNYCQVKVTKEGSVDQVTGIALSETAIATTVDGYTDNTAVTVPTVTVTPNTIQIDQDKDVTWTVGDSSIAKVVDGYVIGVAEGETTLTATVNGVSATAKVTVTDNDKSKLTGVKLNKAATTLLIDSKDSSYTGGNTETLTASLVPTSVDTTKYTKIWTSSNKDVAEVNANGLVTAKKAGTATITVTVGRYSATCTVTVVDKQDTPVDPQPTGFVDVPANAWYANAVNTAAAKGLMNGTGNNKFEPLKTVQRSQVAAIVWNIEGAPAVTGTTPFTDVAADAWYAQAVTWAYQNKVVSGTSATTFAPNQNITRQDFAVVLYNKAGKPAASADLSKFVDASKINSWAQDAVKWAVSKGIINGNDKNELNPTGTLTRAEAASIIVKYVG